MFECDIAHRRSVAVLCMLYNIRCNPMNPLNDALPGPYVLVWVTCDVLMNIGKLIRRFSAELRSTAGVLLTFQCSS